MKRLTGSEQENKMQRLVLDLIATADAAGIPRAVSAKTILMAGLGAMIGATGHDMTRQFVDHAMTTLGECGGA